MMASKLACVGPTRVRSGWTMVWVGNGWPPQSLHSCAPGTDTHDKGPISKLSNENILRKHDKNEKVNHLLAISDTRWWSLAGQTVKQGISRYVFC
ncbi:hypothetical protein TIFTF001_039944 [Ficus carica]|uniref:Uncharacterized protein n=1 Tax=Ficus carica TaxID=3494 RepID=A0AA87YW96_FICCA|nr:hypothetical protein TIFTF001_039944 [Ficus carica]